MSVEQIQALADGLAGRLGRAVVVDDRELRLVAASADFGDADPARVWSLLNRRTRRRTYGWRSRMTGLILGRHTGSQPVAREDAR